MKLAYNIIIAAALLLTSPYWIVRVLLDPAFRTELIQRTRDWKSVPRQTGCLWVHASSVGEVRAAGLLIEALQKRYPDRTVVLSTFTATGYTLATEELECPVFRLPLDLPVLIQPLLQRLNPAILILVEAEYWPNLLHSCAENGVPVMLANGRLSAKSFDRYQKLKPWFLWITGPVSIFSMRAQPEADRLMRLEIDPERVQVTGNVKFDNLPMAGGHSLQPDPKDGITVIFGSTRTGEETAVVKAISQLSQNPLNCKFIIAPRHMQRCGEVGNLLKAAGLSYTRHSSLNNSPEGWTAPVLLVDALGVLNEYYRQGHIAFVGGGFDPRHGGHNILEPALLGLPVIYGKHMGNFEEEARLLAESGGGIQIEKTDELTAALEKLLSDLEDLRQRGRWAAEAVQRQKGAVNRNLDLIQSLLEKSY